MANMNPKPGKKPMLPVTNPTGMLMNKVLAMRAPVLHEIEASVELTIGQVRLLNKKQITLIMTDDQGRYELAEGPDMSVVKRRA
jgi:hypothetical protein